MNLKPLLGLGLLVLSGCVSMGEEDYSCPGSPQGVNCMDSMEVLKLTRDPEKARQHLKNEREKYLGHDNHVKEVVVDGSPIRLGNNIKAVSQPVPILKDAEVMRVWIAPWTDELTDLHWPGYIFTEITPRRWTFGEQEVKSTKVLTQVPVNKD